jgi:pilus assembly protein CpaC
VIADAVIRTPRRIYVTGVAVGQSNVIVFDRAGQQIVSLELSVERDTVDLGRLIARLVPESRVNVEIISDNVVLTGSVKNAADARKVQDIASVFVNGGAQVQQQQQQALAGAGAGAGGGGGTVSVALSGGASTPTSKIINMLSIEGEDQVQLKVTIAEVQRNVIKQLGVDFNGASGKFGISTSPPFGVTAGGPQGTALGFGTAGASASINVAVRALEQSGAMRTLAEPTLTAISGESASFLAGGEFPVPTGRDQNGNVTVAFKPFGVALAMTPIVLSDGRISLRVKTEVSELSQDGAIQLGDISLPSLKVRRAETTLELPSGGSMVLGGLLQDSVRQSIGAIPGIGKLPVLGQLFRSRDFQRSETELVIIATPYLVKPVPRSALATPDQGYVTPSDAQTILFGSLNRIYGGAGDKTSGQKYQGRVGYIYE